MVELLAIKSGDEYIRFLETGFEICNMAKASVYPLSQEGTVVELMERYQKQGLANAYLVKMSISEERYP